MLYLKSFSLLLLVIFSATQTLAAPERSRHEAQIEELRWKTTMAEGSHILNQSEETKRLLLSALDELAPYECMPELHTKLAYSGEPEEASCLEVLAKIKELDPYRPVVQCIEHGIDSSECITAYRGQRTVSSGQGRTRPNLRSAAIRKLDGDLSKLRAIDDKADLDTYIGAARAISTALRLSCEDTITKALERQPERVVSRPTPSRPPTGQGSLGLGFGDAFSDYSVIEKEDQLSPMERLAAELAKDKKEESEIEVPATHERLVSADCLHYINEGKKISSTIAAPVCYEHGLFSPACIQARRLEKRKLESLGQMHRTGGETRGLTSF